MSTSNRDQLVEALNQIIQRMGNRTVIFTHVIAGNIGLSATEFECLDFIQDCGPVPAGRLAELTGLTTGAVTGLIDRLERAGFVRRTADDHDRRRVLVEAIQNDDAISKIRALYEPVSRGFYEITARYSDADVAVITRYLSQSVEMVERVTDEMARAKRETDLA